MKTRNNRYLLTALCLLLAAAGCSTTKRLGDDDILYTGVRKIKIESMTDEDVPSSVESAVKDPLNVKPNNPLYSPYIRTPIPTGLWAWNYLYTERTTGLRAWLYRNLAKEPVLVADDVQPELRMGLVTDILDNHGYFGSTADYEVLPQKNPKKARMSYHVRVAEPWHYSRVEYPEEKYPMMQAIDTMLFSSSLMAGAQYNIDTLTRERIRITNTLRNYGYYYFRPDYIEYLADTVAERYKVDLRMVLANGIPPAAMNSYTTGDVEVRLFNPNAGQETDSTVYNGIKIWYQKPLKLRPKILRQALTIEPGQQVRVDNINQTLTNLTKLGIFRYVNMAVTPLDSLSDDAKTLDMTLSASFDAPMDADLEVDFSSKSNSFIGPGLIFGVRHKNFFKGGEVFSVKLNAAYEWQTGNSSEQANSTSVNSYEFGLNTSLAYPRLIVPRFIKQPVKYPARTTLSLGANLLNRPSFFRMVSASVSGAYDWQSSATSYHNLQVFKLTYNHLISTTPRFDTLMLNNPAIAMSFENQLIPSSSYTYTWDKPIGRARRNRITWQSTVTSAGNLFSGIDALFGGKRPRKVFGNQYSQFVKGQTELKYLYRINDRLTLATRLSMGIGYAYGNSTVMPYSEQFYIGGANSIRAYTIRSIGPGSFRPDPEKTYGYFDQTGDIKLEANAELRIGIFGGLSGAVFIDAGNIWLLEDDPQRPGGYIGSGDFLKKIATGTGVGLRYDISFLIIRADLGIGIHVPYETGKSGYYNIPRFKDGLGFHLAIGYPF